MIENVVGAMPIPLGIAVNFRINGRDYLVPMAIEEPSVVAAASNAARMARERGGFTTSASGPIMIGQIQLVGVPDPHGARMTILAHRDEILSIANEKDPMLVKVGGGAKDVEVRVVDSNRGHMVVTHLIVDCRDANGDLVGTIELPMAVGLVGGATAVHPTAKANVKLLGVKSAQELAEVIAAVGLAQNFAALRALATEGIQKGHMALHARNVAATVGAIGDEVDLVAEVLVKERKVRMDRAKDVLTEIRAGKTK